MKTLVFFSEQIFYSMNFLKNEYSGNNMKKFIVMPIFVM
ncbi:hypothetical protein BSUBE1_2700 [Bacillus subtilis E1]|nr:hypothetical protein BSUBE1_2700 [Bacillus subtilis E1]